MKKSLFLIFLFLILLIYFFSKHLMFFEYFNPYTNTEPLKYIAPAIKELDKGFEYAKKSTNLNGNKIKYLYFNAYGSGFIENNNIPNDLDYAVGVDLGKYNYDGKNIKEIAEKIADKICAFRSAFNFYYNSGSNNHTTIDTTFFAEQKNINRNGIIKNISDALDKALLDEDYVYFTHKTAETEGQKVKQIEVPYIMKSHEILLENMSPIKLYSDLVLYNNSMPRYAREISIVPEYYITINKDGRNHTIELVPESFLGEKLQMKRRLFASCVFVHLKSMPFITNMDYIKNYNNYLYLRNLSFKRHLQEINNIIAIKERLFKLPKRLRQTADLISPVLTNDEYSRIKKYTTAKLSDNNIILLNEYSNILSNIYDLSYHPEAFLTLINNGQMSIMFEQMNIIAEKMKNSNIDKKDVVFLKHFSSDLTKRVSKIKDKKDVLVFQTYLNNEITDIKNLINNRIMANILKTEEISKFVDQFNKIYTEAGYHKITLYWLNQNTIGIKEDDFTKAIKDLNKFAKENDLIGGVKYKLIKEKDAPEMVLRYDIFARDKSSEKENKKLAEINNKMLKDKKNFNLKYKFVFIKKL